MILDGTDAKKKISNEEVADLTLRCLKNTISECSKTNKNYAVMVGGPYTQTTPNEQYKTKNYDLKQKMRFQFKSVF